jgi:hypothetical protein
MAALLDFQFGWGDRPDSLRKTDFLIRRICRPPEKDPGADLAEDG